MLLHLEESSAVNLTCSGHGDRVPSRSIGGRHDGLGEKVRNVHRAIRTDSSEDVNYEEGAHYGWLYWTCV